MSPILADSLASARRDGLPDFNDLIGKPFKDGAGGPEFYDCQGLVVEGFRRFGIPFPKKNITNYAVENVSAAIDAALETLPAGWQEIEKPQVPCLVVMIGTGRDRFISHLAIYVEKGRILHVMRGSYSSNDRLSFWKNRVRSYYAYVGNKIS